MAQEHMDFAQQLARFRACFPGLHPGMVVDSMLAGDTAGELWNVAPTIAPLLVVWDRGNNVFYLTRDDSAGSSLDALAEVVVGQLQPRARADGVWRFKVRAISPQLEESLSSLFPGVALQPTVTHFSVHDTTQETRGPPPNLPGITFLSITPALLQDNHLAGMKYVREEIRGMWPSENRFHEHGFGSLAVLGDEVICWCTAEYVGPRLCGIGIETAPPMKVEAWQRPPPTTSSSRPARVA